jgi:hypothetical protein
MYILAPERDLDPEGAFQRYEEYLRQAEGRLPAGALALATSDWYFDFTDHRAPHDAWLLSASLNETGAGERNEERLLSLRVRLLGAYHDLELEFYYPRVFSYKVEGNAVERGHCGWRYDEFRLNDVGQLVHEIQWWGATRSTTWLICSDDVVFTSRATS